MSDSTTATSSLGRPLSIVVVGGGVSGLAAANRVHRLASDVQVELLESSNRLGGPLHTANFGKLFFERGADSFITKLPWGVELCRELGIVDQLIPTNERFRRALVLRDGALHAIPTGFVLMKPQRLRSILNSPLLSRAGRLRLCLEPLIPALHPTGGVAQDESVASFATRRLGREAYQRLVEPLIAGIYVADGRKLSVAATMPEFLEAEQEHGSLYLASRAARWSARAEDRDASHAAGARYSAFVAPRFGLSTLINALASSLPSGSIRLNSVARCVAPLDGRWQIDIETEGRHERRQADGVVVATSAPQAGALASAFDEELGASLGQIEYAGSVVVTLIYRRDQIGHALDAFGFVVPAIERRPIVAASFPSVKFPDREDSSLTPVRVFLGGALHPDILADSDAQLIEIASQQLRPILSVQGTPVEADVARWPSSMPQYFVGHTQRIDAIERRLRQWRGLEIAGNGYRGVGIPQCIHSGRAAAERVINSSSGALAYNVHQTD